MERGNLYLKKRRFRQGGEEEDEQTHENEKEEKEKEHLYSRELSSLPVDKRR